MAAQRGDQRLERWSPPCKKLALQASDGMNAQVIVNACTGASCKQPESTTIRAVYNPSSGSVLAFASILLKRTIACLQSTTN